MTFRKYYNLLQEFTDKYFISLIPKYKYRYIVSLGVVIVATLLNLKIPVLRSTTDLLFLTAVVISAWYGGLGPSILTVVLSVLAEDYFFLDPNHQVDLSFHDLPLLISFFIVGVVVSSLVSSIRRAEELIAHLASYDHLTRLPNRKLFEDRLDTAEAMADRHNQKLALLFFDVDNFKEVNDRYGHKMGDMFLVELAKILKNCVREEDTVSRWGGDEFVVLISEINSRNDVDTVVRKIYDKLETTITIDAHEIPVCLSCGVSIYPDHGPTNSSLLKRADEALYQAKQAGKNQFRVYEI